MPPEIYPIIAALFTAMFAANGILSILISGWFSRRQRIADANKTNEEAETEDLQQRTTEIDNLRTMLKTWGDQYGGLVERNDNLKLSLAATQAELNMVSDRFDQMQKSAATAIANIREELALEIEHRQIQSKTIIDMQNTITELQLIVEQRGETIRKLRADLSQSDAALNEERRMRTLLEERVAEFDHRSTENVS